MAKQKTKNKKLPSIPTNWAPIPVALVILALGICFIAFSSMVDYLALAVGIFVILGAVVFFVVTMLGTSRRAIFALQILFSVCVLATGVVTIVFREHSAGIICTVFAAAVAVDGSMKLGTALQSKQYSITGKSIAIPISVITIVSALAMVRYTPTEITDENINTCSVIIGITFILDAIGNFIVPFLRRGINKRIANTFTEHYEASAKVEEAPAEKSEATETKVNEIEPFSKEKAEAPAVEAPAKAEDEEVESLEISNNGEEDSILGEDVSLDDIAENDIGNDDEIEEDDIWNGDEIEEDDDTNEDYEYYEDDEEIKSE